MTSCRARAVFIALRIVTGLRSSTRAMVSRAPCSTGRGLNGGRAHPRTRLAAAFPFPFCDFEFGRQTRPGRLTDPYEIARFARTGGPAMRRGGIAVEIRADPVSPPAGNAGERI